MSTPKYGLTADVVRRNLNSMTPAARDAKLGDQINDLTVALNDMAAKFAAFLAHADAGALGTANAATYAPAAAATPVPTLGTR